MLSQLAKYTDPPISDLSGGNTDVRIIDLTVQNAAKNIDIENVVPPPAPIPVPTTPAPDTTPPTATITLACFQCYCFGE